MMHSQHFPALTSAGMPWKTWCHARLPAHAAEGWVPVDLKPLGDYEAFRWFSGQPKNWGPEGEGWRVWFAGNVLDGLRDVLDEHLAVQRMDRVRKPAAIGCVPWLSNDGIVDRLMQMWCCIVVDKNELKYVPDRFINGQRRMPNTVLHMGRYRPDDFPPDEEDLVEIGEEHEYSYGLGPVRVYGWRRQPRITKPILHTKLLVLGELQRWLIEPDGPSYEETVFVPQQVWCGSANWSNASQLHLEMGLACNDEGLIYHSVDYLRTLIKESEPTTSACAGPEPSLVYVDTPDPSPDEIAEYYEYLAERRAEEEELDDDEG
jgi:hypothetical protein